jgi:DNA-binding NarL/FixJ family response regulator
VRDLGFESLPARLATVAELVAEGLSNVEIADTLTVTLHTAEKYVSELKRAVGARDRVSLALSAREWRESRRRHP